MGCFPIGAPYLLHVRYTFHVMKLIPFTCNIMISGITTISGAHLVGTIRGMGVFCQQLLHIFIDFL